MVHNGRRAGVAWATSRPRSGFYRLRCRNILDRARRPQDTPAAPSIVLYERAELYETLIDSLRFIRKKQDPEKSLRSTPLCRVANPRHPQKTLLKWIWSASRRRSRWTRYPDPCAAGPFASSTRLWQNPLRRKSRRKPAKALREVSRRYRHAKATSSTEMFSATRMTHVLDRQAFSGARSMWAIVALRRWLPVHRNNMGHHRAGDVTDIQAVEIASIVQCQRQRVDQRQQGPADRARRIPQREIAPAPAARRDFRQLLMIELHAEIIECGKVMASPFLFQVRHRDAARLVRALVDQRA